MERIEVENIVKHHMADVLEMDTTEIESNSTMGDIGATSLDVVEVISLSMRELKVKVPRSELEELENVHQLVDLLHRLKLAA
jgi:acyl carrier protein